MTVQLGDKVLMLHDIGSFRAEDSRYHGYLKGQTYTVGTDMRLALAQELNGETLDGYWQNIIEIEGESPT